MLSPPTSAADAVFFVLALWALSGYTIVHIAVVATRWPRALWRRWRDVPARPHRRALRKAQRMTLAFIVPVYNEETTVGPTLESLLRQSVRPDEIVVVDDRSTDRTLEALRPYQKRGVRVVALPSNGGKARAVEAGLAEVESDLVALTDADSIVHRDYVRYIKENFADPRVVAAGGYVESIPHSWVTAARQVEYFLTLHVDRAAQNDMGAIFVLPGVSTTYRRETLLRYGFEHDTIGEDLDLTFRLHEGEERLVMDRRARVHTSDPPTLRAYARQLNRWYTDIWLCTRKHRSLFGKRVFGAVELPLTLVNSVLAALLFLALPLYLAAFDRERLVHYLVAGTAIDVVVIALASIAGRRLDVWWTLLSRYPTRVVSRYIYLKTLLLVACRRQDMRWGKLERRSITAALASVGGGKRGNFS